MMRGFDWKAGQMSFPKSCMARMALVDKALCQLMSGWCRPPCNTNGQLQPSLQGKGLSKIRWCSRKTESVGHRFHRANFSDRLRQARLQCQQRGWLSIPRNQELNMALIQCRQKSIPIIGAADENVSNLGPLLVLADADVCEQFFRISRICIEPIHFQCMFPFVKVDLHSLDGGFASSRWTSIRLLPLGGYKRSLPNQRDLLLLFWPFSLQWDSSKLVGSCKRELAASKNIINATSSKETTFIWHTFITTCGHGRRRKTCFHVLGAWSNAGCLTTCLTWLCTSQWTWTLLHVRIHSFFKRFRIPCAMAILAQTLKNIEETLK